MTQAGEAARDNAWVWKSVNLTDPYVAAGPHAYLVGAQDGTFPPIGSHIPGAMGGLWQHPHRLLDGFRLGIAREGQPVVWPLAAQFGVASWGVRLVVPVDPALVLDLVYWCPEDRPGVVVEAAVEHRGPTPARLTLWLAVRSDLRPGWLDDAPRGEDAARVIGAGVLFTNSAHPWWAAAVGDAAVAPTTAIPAGHNLAPGGPGALAGLRHPLVMRPGETLTARFWLTGGASPPPRGIVLPPSLPTMRRRAVAAAAEREGASRLCLPDDALAESARWTRHQVAWLVRSVPGRGTGLGAGLPEYPWWFGCDSFYALPAANTFGRHALARSTLELLVDASRTTNGNGRVIHEQSTTGRVYNPGNVQESAQFCRAVWDTYCWTQDRDWLARMLPAVEAALGWVQAQDETGRGLAPGAGIIEVPGLDARMLDTAVHTAAGLHDWAAMLRAIGETERAAAATRAFHRLLRRITALYWIPERQLYGDLLAAPAWIRTRREEWAAWAEARGRHDAARRYRTFPVFDRPGGEQVALIGNWIVNTPMAEGLAPRRMALQALARMRRAPFRGPHGLYLSAAEQREAMTISSGVQAFAEARYGQADAALTWMAPIIAQLHRRMPGSMTEMSPDGGCFVQAWTAYGIWAPLIRGFFGLTPGPDETLRFAPHMPMGWREAAVEGVRVGANRLSVSFVREGPVERCRLVTERPWTVVLDDARWVGRPLRGGARPVGCGRWRLEGGTVWEVTRPAASAPD